MANNQGFISVELVRLEYDINFAIESGDYAKAAELIKENSELYEFDITIADRPAEIIQKINNSK
jgi:hypothetical protein